MRSTIRNGLGSRLRELRTKADLSQADLAIACGLDQGTVSRIESGDSKNPGLGTLEKLAAGLRVTIDDLRSDESRRSLRVLQRK
jgi:transcriptional regulator with XRE-family HTH domain